MELLDIRRTLEGLFIPDQAVANSSDHKPSKVYVFEDLKVRKTEVLESRQLIDGKTVDGCKFSVHESPLQPGHEPHAPHHHNGEEMFLIVDGALDVPINGKTSRIA